MALVKVINTNTQQTISAQQISDDAGTFQQQRLALRLIKASTPKDASELEVILFDSNQNIINKIMADKMIASIEI